MKKMNKTKTKTNLINGLFRGVIPMFLLGMITKEIENKYLNY